jgi:hypothetical protein
LVQYWALGSSLIKFHWRLFLHLLSDFSNTFLWIPGAYGTCQHLNYPWFFALPPFVRQTFANAKTAPRVITLLSWLIVSGSLYP